MKAQDLLIDHEQVEQATKALQNYSEKWEEANKSKKKNLLQESSNSSIFLQMTLKKIPKLSSIQMIKVPLPHSLLTDTSEICLITGDLDKKDRKADVEPTVQHYKDLLARHGVNCITGIVSLRQLRTEYKTFEARRQLYGTYDSFLADDIITGCLPNVLGKFFFKKRKFPQQINLRSSNLKKLIDNATSRTVFFLTGRGSSCSSEVAHFGLSVKQITENIEAAVNRLKLKIPGGWQNLSGLYIKTAKSVAIPLYISLESANNVELPVAGSDDDDDVEAEDITTLRRSKVKVYPDGNVELIPNIGKNSSEDESDFEERLLGKEKVLKARKIIRKRNLQMYKTEMSLKKKARMNFKTEESSKKKSNVRMEGLKKQTMKKRKIDVDFNIEELKVPAKKKKIADTEEIKRPAKKKKIADIEEIKRPAKKKNVDFNIKQLKELTIKKEKMDTNISNKMLKQSTRMERETGANVCAKGAKEPAAKKKKTGDNIITEPNKELY